MFRSRGDIVEYLLVQASDNARDWVLPKGHIEQGENAEETALREVREEAGVVARVIGLVPDSIRFFAKGEEVTVWFYLMEYLSEMQATENRAKVWVTYDEALRRIKYKETKTAISAAERMRAAC